MSSSLGALEQLLALSEAMLDAAREERWEALASLEAARRALADRLPEALANRVPLAAQPRARALIEACLHCDKRVQPLAARRQNELQIILREPRPSA